jgi:hypothetical protein
MGWNLVPFGIQTNAQKGFFLTDLGDEFLSVHLEKKLQYPTIDGFYTSDFWYFDPNGLLNACPHGHDGHIAVLAIAQPFDFDNFIICNIHYFNIAAIYCEVGTNVVKGRVNSGY